MGGAIGPDELASLFDAHATALALYARQWCDRSGSEDVVQKAFLALARERRNPAIRLFADSTESRLPFPRPC